VDTARNIVADIDQPCLGVCLFGEHLEPAFASAINIARLPTHDARGEGSLSDGRHWNAPCGKISFEHELTPNQTACKEPSAHHVLEGAMAEEYSLADLVEITGAKPRSLQIWAERGVIQPIKSTSGAGTGHHRLFSRAEAIIACIIHPFAMRQMAIGELLDLSGAIRQHYAKRPDIYEKARGGGDASTLLSVEIWYEDAKETKMGRLLSVYQGSTTFKNSRKPGAIVMIIRLETHLAKLTK
jgi:hypothetical protein